MPDLNTLKTRLNEAEEAYHQLQTGNKAVEMMMNGRKIVYTQANITELRCYITQLQTDISRIENAPKTRQRPIYLNLR